MSELRTLLERAAEDYHPHDDVYGRTVQRARRLRARRRLGAAAVAIAIAAGGISFAALAFVGVRPGPAAPTPPPAKAAPSIGRVLYTCGTSFCVLGPGSDPGRSVRWGGGPSPQWDPAISPDGTKVAYRAYYGLGDGMYALYVANIDGSDPIRITHDIAGDPSWSPDGRRIAFDTSGAGAIWVVNADGTRLRELTPGITPSPGHGQPATGLEDASPTWSPDGRSIAFVRFQVAANPGPPQLYVMRTDGRGVRAITSGSVSFADPAWSPDFRTIAADGLVGERSQIYVLGPDGSELRAVTSGRGQSWNPRWTADGRIAFLSDRTGATGLYLMAADGSGVEQVVSDLVPGGAPGDMQFALATIGSGVPGSVSAPECASPPHPGAYAPAVAPGSAAAGSRVTISGVVPVYAEDGSYAGPSGAIEVWWNVDPNRWESIIGGMPSPGTDAPVAFLGQQDVSGECRYSIEVTVPDAAPGRYPIVVLETSPGGVGASLQPLYLDVTAP